MIQESQNFERAPRETWFHISSLLCIASSFISLHVPLLPPPSGRYGEAPPLAAHTFLYAADLAPSTSGTKQPYRRGSDQVPESAQKAVLLSVERPAGISLASRRDSVRKDSVAGSVAGGADSAARGTPLPAELMNRPHRVSGPVDVAGPVSVIRRDLSNNEMVSRESIMEMQKARRRSRKSSAGRYTVATYPEDQVGC